MKRNYIQPAMFAVRLWQQSQILTGSITDVEGNVDVNYGGEGTEPARVKPHSIWDEDW